MEQRCQIIAEFLSCVTGIPKDKLREFEQLRTLLERAENPGDLGIEGTYDFGTFRFIFPHGGRLILLISIRSSSEYHRLQKLQSLLWPGMFYEPWEAFFQAALDDKTIQKAKEELATVAQ
jgi:hypothetical protein